MTDPTQITKSTAAGTTRVLVHFGPGLRPARRREEGDEIAASATPHSPAPEHHSD